MNALRAWTRRRHVIFIQMDLSYRGPVSNFINSGLVLSGALRASVELFTFLRYILRVFGRLQSPAVVGVNSGSLSRRRPIGK